MSLVFGKYEKIRRIAQGGMGDVYLARQTGVIDRIVILKSLREDLAKEKDFVEQFLDEARVAANLNHPNIVAIYDVGEWLGSFTIAMEYVAGEDLSRLWYAAAKAGVGLPFQVSVRVVADAALGLDHAHTAKDLRGLPLGIVHRDVSPQNIMVRGDGVTKLVDFGIAKAANKNSRTQAGMVKGKLQYMSPEQVRGEALDGRSDQFSLGIVLWEMCTGRRLFKAENEVQTLQKILQLPIQKPSQVVPGFPAELEAVIGKMLDRDPQKRFRTCGDVAAELKGYLDRTSAGGGDVTVSSFVQQILGKELDEKIRDLTPMEPTEAGAPLPEPVGAGQKVKAFSSQSSQLSSSKAAQAPAQKPQVLVNQHAKQPTVPVIPGLKSVGISVEETVIHDETNDDAADALAEVVRGREGGFVVERASGAPLKFAERSTLHQWILDGTVGKSDLLRAPGGKIVRLGDEADLQKYFEIAAASRRVTEPAQAASTVSPGPPLAQAGFGDTSPLMPLARQPTISAEAPGVIVDDGPRPTAGFSLGELPRSMTGTWGAPQIAQAMADPRTLEAQTPATLPPGDDTSDGASELEPRTMDLVRPRRRVPTAVYVAAGVVGALVLVVGLLAVAAPQALRAAFGGGAAASTVVDDTLAVVAEDDAAALQALSPALREKAKGAHAAEAAAAALVELALARIGSQANLLEDAAVKAGAKPLPPPRADVDALLSSAYALSTRALGSDAALPAARVALATYQAQRGASAERDAELAKLATMTLSPAEAAELSMLRQLSSPPSAPLEPQAPQAPRVARAALIARALAVPAPPADEAAQAARATELAELTRQAEAWRTQSPTDRRALALSSLLTQLREQKPPKPAPPPPPPPPPPVVEETYEQVVQKAKGAAADARAFEAAKQWRKALKLKPGTTEAQLGLAWALRDLGKNDLAAQQFRVVTGKAPNLAEAYVGLGEALRADGKTLEAIAAFEKYLELAPDGPDANVARNAIRALQ